MTDHNDTVVHNACTFKIKLCIEAIQTVRKIRKILKIHEEGKKKSTKNSTLQRQMINTYKILMHTLAIFTLFFFIVEIIIQILTRVK